MTSGPWVGNISLSVRQRETKGASAAIELSTPHEEEHVLLPPPGLCVHAFGAAGDDFALFEFPLPVVRMPPGLSSAERSVTSMILAGASNEDIARVRGTSARTVANQIRAIYGKLGISGRLDLARVCAAAREDEP